MSMLLLGAGGTDAPGIPTSPSATAAGSGVTLNATAPAGTVTGYAIYRGTSPGGEASTPIATGVSLPYLDTTVAGNTTYYYTIAAQVGATVGKPSTEVSALSYPGVPTGLSVSGAGTGTLTVSWTAPSGGASTYDVQRSTDDATWSAYSTGQTGTSTTDTGAGVYYYRVRANNAAGSSGYTTGVGPDSPWVLYDTFAGSNGTNITAHTPNVYPSGGGSWAAIDGTGSTAPTIELDGNGFAHLFAYHSNQSLATTKAVQAPFTLTAVFESVTGSLVDSGPLVSFNSTGMNGFLLNWNSGSLTLFEVSGSDWGTLTVRSSYSATPANNTLYTLALSYSSGLLNVSVNGTIVIQYTTTDYTSQAYVGWRYGYSEFEGYSKMGTLKVTSP